MDRSRNTQLTCGATACQVIVCQAFKELTKEEASVKGTRAAPYNAATGLDLAPRLQPLPLSLTFQHESDDTFIISVTYAAGSFYNKRLIVFARLRYYSSAFYEEQ